MGAIRRRGKGRSIPACAGEPCSAALSASMAEVYPRVCGGTFTTFPESCILTGLSPRVRGNHFKIALARWLNRSIPACAGEPSSATTHRGFHWVYPRVCGGTAVPLGTSNLERGLSPRVRGNPK